MKEFKFLKESFEGLCNKMESARNFDELKESFDNLVEKGKKFIDKARFIEANLEAKEFTIRELSPKLEESEIIEYTTIRKKYYILRYKLNGPESKETYRAFITKGDWLFETATLEDMQKTLDDMDAHSYDGRQLYI